MTSILKLLAQNCGMTMQETAQYLEQPLETVGSWWRGRRTCPETVLTKLIKLQEKLLLDAEDWARVLQHGETHWPAEQHLNAVRLALFTLPEKVILGLKLTNPPE